MLLASPSPQNGSLKRLFLTLFSQGAISLAKFLPESSISISPANPGLDLAGLLALFGGLKVNWVLRCLNADVSVRDEECMRVCRDILNTCIHNTEESEHNVRRGGAESGVPVHLRQTHLLFLLIDGKGTRGRESIAKVVVGEFAAGVGSPIPSTAASESLSGFVSPTTFSHSPASFAKDSSPAPSPSKPPPSETKAVIPGDESNIHTRTGNPEHQRGSRVCTFNPLEEFFQVLRDELGELGKGVQEKEAMTAAKGKPALTLPSDATFPLCWMGVYLKKQRHLRRYEPSTE